MKMQLIFFRKANKFFKSQKFKNYINLKMNDEEINNKLFDIDLLISKSLE